MTRPISAPGATSRGGTGFIPPPPTRPAPHPRMVKRPLPPGPRSHCCTTPRPCRPHPLTWQQPSRWQMLLSRRHVIAPPMYTYVGHLQRGSSESSRVGQKRMGVPAQLPARSCPQGRRGREGGERHIHASPGRWPAQHVGQRLERSRHPRQVLQLILQAVHRL